MFSPITITSTTAAEQCLHFMLLILTMTNGVTAAATGNSSSTGTWVTGLVVLVVLVVAGVVLSLLMAYMVRRKQAQTPKKYNDRVEEMIEEKVEQKQHTARKQEMAEFAQEQEDKEPYNDIENENRGFEQVGHQFQSAIDSPQAIVSPPTPPPIRDDDDSPKPHEYKNMHFSQPIGGRLQ